MHERTNTSEAWGRFVAELREDQRRERAEWGDLDDNTLAKYISGMVSEEEKQRVETAMRQFENVRELVELSKETWAEPDHATISGSMTRGQIRPQQMSYVRWLVAAVALLLAIAGVWFIARFDRSGPMETLVATVDVTFGDIRGNELAQDQDVYLTIGSPRAGYATIGVLESDTVRILPQKEEDPVQITKSAKTVYGPVRITPQTSKVVVVVTESPISDYLHTAFPTASRLTIDPDEFQAKILQLLSEAGVRWAATSHVTISRATNK